MTSYLLVAVAAVALSLLSTLPAPASSTASAEEPAAVSAASALPRAATGSTSSPTETLSRAASAPAALAIPGLRPEVFEAAVAAAACATGEGLVARPELLTVIDYSLPSSQKRLWVLDLERGEVLFHEHTSHGKESGDDYTTAFSNVSMSLMSNLGLMTTAETYYGKNGYSLRLDGHEPGINDLARERAIVIHGAWYMSEGFLAEHGRMGRSWGCPALDEDVNRDLIDTIAGGSVVFGYYPDQQWLGGSRFLSCGGETNRLATKTAP